MQFSAALTAALFGATAFGARSRRQACPPAADDERTIYNINDFTTRKYDGKTVATVFFNIAATNGGTLDFQCVPYDPVTKAGTQAFESTKVYACGDNSSFSFSYDVATTQLFLWQTISDDNTIGGNLETGEPICRAGGSNVDDLICSIPAVVPLSIAMTKLGE